MGSVGRPGALWPRKPAASLDPGAGQLRDSKDYGNEGRGGDDVSLVQVAAT